HQPRFGARMAFRTGAGSSGTNRTDSDTHRPNAGSGLTPAPAGHRAELHIERVVLSNGLVLLLSENHTTPAVSVRAVVNAGSRFEPDQKAGLASLVGELLDEGTAARTSRQIAETVESLGAKLETYGEYQTSGVAGAFLAKDFPVGLDVIADIITGAIFPEDKVEDRIDRRMAQIKSRLDVPRVLASDTFNQIIFKGYPQHRPSIGFAETVKALTRENLLEYFRRYYVPNNTILAIVGDIDIDSAKQKAEEMFGHWPGKAGFDLPDIPLPKRQTAPIERFVSAPKEQVNIYMGHLGIQRKNPDYYALLIMDTILGSSPGFTSRIPRILRDEEGLAYTTFSNITGSARLDPGRFVAYIGTSPQNLDQALVGLKREISRMVHEPVTADELESAKSYLTGNFVFDFQTNSQVAQFALDAETYELGFDYLLRYPELIRDVTIEDVSRVANKYIDPERMTTVVVGPVAKNESGGRA
ncbi:MAG: M16 family metallopeptidase, partial [Blastocatellia bacterium]